jgi:hypothetical protein
MLKALLVAGALALAGTTASALAQEKQPPAAQPEVTLIGLPVYSSDGQNSGPLPRLASQAGSTRCAPRSAVFLGSGRAPS